MVGFMEPLSTGMLIVFVFASAITVFAMMRVFTNIVEHETDLHDLRNRIKQLQFDRQLYMARIAGHIGPEDDVEIVEDEAETGQSPANHSLPKQSETSEPAAKAA